METATSVGELIRRQVPDWDDDVISTARFKAFSGQRPDWEPKYLFWRHLILSISRHFNLLTIRPSQVKNEWFNRGGLTPLCLDHVLSLMYDEGDIIRSGDLVDPTVGGGGRLFQLLRRVKNLVVKPGLTPAEVAIQDHFILIPLLKDKAAEVVKVLAESHWTSSCVVTMKEFQGVCGGPTESTAVLSYLSGCGKACYLSTKKKEFIEGVKVSLLAAPVYTISNLDYDVLHLVWTSEKLHQQIGVIDQRYENARKSALLSLKGGNKSLALRHAKEMKLASQNREKCTSLLNRVDEVINVIADAETTKKVSEAIKIGAQAIKQNGVGVDDVEHCLEELEESIVSQKQVDKALESTTSYGGLDDEDIEAEFEELQLQVDGENLQLPVPRVEDTTTVGETATLESADILSNALSNLNLEDASVREPENQHPVTPFLTPTGNKDSKFGILEAA